MSFPVEKKCDLVGHALVILRMQITFLMCFHTPVPNMTLLCLLFITLILNLSSFRALILKNYDSSEMLPYLQGNESACIKNKVKFVHHRMNSNQNISNFALIP